MAIEREAKAGQVLPVGDCLTSAFRRLPDVRKRNPVYGRLLTHAINLAKTQPNRDSSWVADELINFGPNALSLTELQRETLALLGAEYQKQAIAKANGVLIQVGSKDLGVQNQPPPEEKFLQLFHWARENKLVTAETVVNLLPYWANIIPFWDPTDTEHLFTFYNEVMQGWRKVEPSVPARLLAGAIAAKGLAEILEKEEGFARVAKQFKAQAKAQIVLAGAGAAALPNTLSLKELKPVIADFFGGQPGEEEKRTILARTRLDFVPAVIAFHAFTTKEIYGKTGDQTEELKRITFEVVRSRWPQFKSQLTNLYPFLTPDDFEIMEATVARGLFLTKEI